MIKIVSIFLKCIILFLHIQIFAADIYVTNFGARGDDKNNDLRSFQLAIETLKNGDRLILSDGTYFIGEDAIILSNLENVTIEGKSKSKVVIKKLISSAPEYLLRAYHTKNLKIRNITFEGLTTDSSIKWGEQGVMLASTKDSVIENCNFKNFGDAAIRTHTYSKDPTDKPINSYNTRIINNNFFNIAQITTTQANGDNHGGTQDVLIENNIFENLKSSIKCASRKSVTGCIIKNNTVKNSSGDAVQVSSFSHVTIDSNTFENIKGFGLNFYRNGEVKKGYALGHLIVKNNIFRKTGGGLRINNDPYPDKSEFDLTNVTVQNNIFDDIGSNYKTGVIALNNTTKNKKVKTVNILDNFFRNIKANAYVSIGSRVEGLKRANNQAWPVQFSETSIIKGNGDFPSSVKPNTSTADNDSSSDTNSENTSSFHLSIYASGHIYKGAPQLQVVLGEKILATVKIVKSLNKDEIQKVSLDVSKGLAKKRIELRFINDYYEKQGADRNLFIHDIYINDSKLNLEKAKWVGSGNKYQSGIGKLLSNGHALIEDY